MLGSLNDVWSYSVLGMFADSFEDEANSSIGVPSVNPWHERKWTICSLDTACGSRTCRLGYTHVSARLRSRVRRFSWTYTFIINICLR